MKLVKHLLLLVLRLNLNFIRLNDFGSAVHAAGPFFYAERKLCLEIPCRLVFTMKKVQLRIHIAIFWWKISLHSVDENYFTNLLISYILSIQQLKGKQFTASIFFS